MACFDLPRTGGGLVVDVQSDLPAPERDRIRAALDMRFRGF